MPDKAGLQSTRITEVKGHADDELVWIGAVEQVDKNGDRRRVFSQACHTWYPLVYNLHRFFISVARVVVNNDDKGGSALDPMVCRQLAQKTQS